MTVQIPHDLVSRQRQGHESGRLRIGQAVKTGKKDKNGRDITRPTVLKTFRFTSASQMEIEAVAEAYGGEARPWDNRGHAEFEVLTDAAKLLVTIPPGRDAITAYWEMWSGGGCVRRCDSRLERKSGGPCLCPHAEDPGNEDEVETALKRRAELASMKTPQACSLKTRMNFILPDLPDVGVWRLDTGSMRATGGILGKLRLMEMARDQGVYLPAQVWVDHQVEVHDGQTSRFPVIVVELMSTFREIATGQLAGKGWAAQLPPAPGEQRRAITSSTTAPPLREVAPPALPRPQRPPTAQEIADAAAKAVNRVQIRDMKVAAEEHRVVSDMICPPGAEIYEELDSYLHARFEELPEAAAS